MIHGSKWLLFDVLFCLEMALRGGIVWLSGRVCHCLFCNAEILDHLTLVTRIKGSLFFLSLFFSLKSCPNSNQLIWLSGSLGPKHAWMCVNLVNVASMIVLVVHLSRVVNTKDVSTHCRLLYKYAVY